MKKFGYVYNLDIKSGNFTITVAPGYYIHADWKESLYHIHIQINQSGFLVDSKERDNIFMISPYDIENCKSVFDKIVTDLQLEHEKYESAIKGAMGAKLLKSMIAPTLRKYKLTATQVESCTDDKSVSLLKKKVFGNVFLGTKITFNDYEEGINRMVTAFKNLPNWIMDFDSVTLNSKGVYNRNFSGKVGWGKGLDLIDDPDDTKYSYRCLPIFDTSTNNEYSQSELSQKLAELDYIYYLETDGTYNIFLQTDMLLCRNYNKVWVKKHLGPKLSKETNMTDEEFYILLKILTWDCLGKGATWRNDWWDCRSIPRLMAKSISNILPKSVDKYSIFDEGIAIHYKNIWYMIDNENQHPLSLTEKIINYMRADLNLSDYMMFPGIDIIVKE